MTLLRNLPIRQKLTVAILGTTTLALLVACGSFIYFEARNYRRTLEDKTTVLADIVGRSCEGAMDFGNASEAEDNLRTLGADAEILAAALYQKDGSGFANYTREGVAVTFPTEPSAEPPRVAGGRIGVFRPVLREGKQVGTIYVEATLAKLYVRLRAYLGISAAVLGGSLLVAALFAAGLQRVISRPIVRLARTAQEISQKKDYALRAEKLGNDELGQLSDSLNEMLAAIAERSSALEKANLSLRTQSEQIGASVGVLGTAAKEIVDFTTQVAAAAAQTATAITETTTTVEEVRQTAQVSSDRARGVSESAQRAAQSSRLGKQSTEETIAGMDRIREQMRSIAQSMVRLSEQSQAIAQIVATVDDLAAQSSLLSVNASIEAAKAGAQGKGFAVVAQEVKNLADQSKQATKQVRAILSDIQKATSAAVLASEQGNRAVDAGVAQSTEAGRSIVELAESVAIAAQAASQIAASSQQQLVGMDQVASAMMSVKDASVESVGSAKELEAAARKLNELGENLRRIVGKV